MRDIRDNVRAILESRGFNHAEIARRSNLTPSKLSRILSKKRRLEAQELLDLCDAMGYSPNDIRFYDGSKPPQQAP